MKLTCAKERLLRNAAIPANSGAGLPCQARGGVRFQVIEAGVVVVALGGPSMFWLHRRLGLAATAVVLVTIG